MARGVTLVRESSKVGRKTRSPRHSFRLKQTPWTIQPFMFAPVLPGETMTNALIQCKAYTPLVDDQKQGWWYEMYFFYVKHRDLLTDAAGSTYADAAIAMHLDGAVTFSQTVTTKRPLTYANAGAPEWQRGCLNAIVHWYFRSEGEAVWEYTSVAGQASGGSLTALPIASILQDTWMDSMKNEDETINIPVDELPGEYPVLPDDVDPAFSAHFAQWEMMHASGIYTATFADYLRSFGVTPSRDIKPKQEILKPELLRYIRDWKYPQPSMVGGTTGYNVRWDMAERIDKDRFFSEPGFIVGVAVARPKVYYAKQVDSAIGMLNNAYAWLPAVLRDEPYTSLKRFAAGTGPIQGVTDDYWVDIKDLYMHGDQFVNFNTLDGSNANIALQEGFVTLPSSTLRRRYLDPGELRSNFVGDTGEISVDGVVTLDIKTRLEDTSGHGSEGNTFLA